MAQNQNLGTLAQVLTVNSTANTIAFASSVTVGNSTVNSVVNSTSISINGVQIINSAGSALSANNALYLGGTAAASYQLNSTLAANVAALPANNASYLGGTAAASYQLNSTLNANIAAYLPTYAGVVNASSHTVGSSFTANSTGVYTSGNGSFVGATVTAVPVNNYDVVNKLYADAIASGVNFHQAVKLATTQTFDVTTATYNNGANGVGATITDITPFIALSLDGVNAVVNDRVLMKNASNTAWNGVYFVSNVGSASYPWILTRATDYDNVGSGYNEIDNGDLIYVTGGATLAGTSWVESSNVAVIGTDPITFVQFSAKGAFPLTNGTGLYYSVGVAYDGSAASTLAVNSSYIATISANNASYLGGTAAASYALLSGALFTGAVNATAHTIGTTWVANASGVYMTMPLSANGGTGTAGQLLYSNGATGSPYWAAAPANYTISTGLVNTTGTITVNNSYIATIAANNASYLGGTAAASYALLSGATFTGNITTGDGTSLNLGREVTNGLEGGQINFASANSLNAAYPAWATDVYANQFRILNGGASNTQVQMFGASTGVVGLYVQGNVGIGTTSPGGKLDVQAGNTYFTIAPATYTSATVGPRPAGDGTSSFVLQANSTAGNKFDSTSAGLSVYANNLATFHTIFASNGNIGIGTTSPASKLDVNGGINSTGISATGNMENISPTRLGVFLGADSLNTVNRGIDIACGNTATGWIDFTTVSVDYKGRIAYDYTNNNLYFATNSGSASMLINSAGNINIGGNNDAGNTLRYLDIQSANTGSSAGSIIRLITSNTAGTGTTSVDIVKYKTGGFYLINNEPGTSGFTAFNVGASERLRIDSSGRVGINTTAPVNLLTLNGGNADDTYGMLQAVYSGTTTGINAGFTAKNYQGTSQFMQWDINGVRIGSRIITNTGAGNVYLTYGNDTIGLTLYAAGYTQAVGSLRAPIFYDTDDTGYYTNPAGTSALSVLNLYGGAGGAQINMYSGGDLNIYSAANSYGATIWCDPPATGMATAGYVFVERLNNNNQRCGYDRQWDNYPSISVRNDTTNGPQGEFRIHGINGVSGGDFSVTLRVDGGVIGHGTSYFPFIYDFNDTAYYCDPNSASVFYGLTHVGGTAYFQGGRGINQCCGDDGAISVGGDGTKPPRIAWHSAGIMEGTIEGSGTGWRKIYFYDQQGSGLGVHATGQIASNQNIVAYYSDRRLKEDFEKVTDHWNVINNVTGYRFTWNERAGEIPGFISKVGTREVGLIAQDVNAVYPEAVYTRQEGPAEDPYKTILHDRFTPIFIEALKELKREIDLLKEENIKLRELINA
ncbi:Intramolecular chaperone auto-processing domain containing protein [uncultured Caudovirales phage]|uniref:Intramolecular chaperone auto-processing domain containing protein n=1 Tax=uncultured Caudovirales phage TaxID=2100421 RepID=A0A6J5LE34_9CAUD|nr:Intramolecular chaperone auto-processing domain containing protein [uncultured Caudovirales phage]